MKKKIVLIILLVIIVSVISGGTVYFFMSNKSSNKETSIVTDTTNNLENSIGNIEDTNNIVSTNNSTKKEIKTPKKEQARYTCVALCGCVITEVTKEGSVTYKLKCETCGTVQPGTKTIFVADGTYSSSFYCPNCKKMQEVKIETTVTYE
jgi:ABC-type Na+ efflux pump permease subunit